MTDVSIVPVAEQHTAAVRARVSYTDMPAKLIQLMDQVWKHVRGAGIQGCGDNVWLYRMTGEPELDVEIGVQVSQPIAGDGEVVASTVPGGRAAHAVHHGDYTELPGVHQAVFTWCEKQRLPRSSTCWEVYGDHHADPAKRRTDVYHLIAD